jgi:futalosine hydrolase
MRILLVTATAFEQARFAGVERQGKHSLESLVTGIGPASAGIALARRLAQAHAPDLVLNLGIAGSFSERFVLGSVVEVTEEAYGDLGAEAAEGSFLSVAALGFPAFVLGDTPYFNVVPHPGYPAGMRPTGLPPARGLTVSKTHGTEASIAAARRDWPEAEVETMEGAAIFQACLLAGAPCFQVRGISNFVAPRDRAAWKVPEAVAAVQGWVDEWVSKW